MFATGPLMVYGASMVLPDHRHGGAPAPGSVCATALTAGKPAPRRRPRPPDRALSPAKIRTAEKAYAQGVRAMEKGDVDAAEKAFAKAVKADPSNRQYSADLQIAQQNRVAKLVQDADKARIMGQPEVARAKLATALALDPKNPEVSQHIYDLAHLASTASPDGSLNATFAPAIELTPKPGKQSFHSRSTAQAVVAASAGGLWAENGGRRFPRLADHSLRCR